MKKREMKAEEFFLSCKEEKGAAAVEYALITGLIAVAIIPAVAALGERMTGIFQELSNALSM